MMQQILPLIIIVVWLISFPSIFFSYLIVDTVFDAFVLNKKITGINFEKYEDYFWPVLFFGTIISPISSPIVLPFVVFKAISIFVFCKTNAILDFRKKYLNK